MTDELIPKSGKTFNARQRFFVRYFALVMTDIVVLNLFAEFWSRVHLTSFSVSIGAAVILQLLLKLTMALEHRVSGFFTDRTHRGARALKLLSLWLVLFGSKFVILWALGLALGSRLHFDGALHGMVPLITVIVVMLLAELLVARLTEALGQEEDDSSMVS